MSRVSSRSFLSTVLCSGLFAALPIACKTAEPHDQAENTANSVVSVGGAAGQTQLRLDQTLNALEKVSARGEQNPKPAYDEFASSLGSFSSELKDMSNDHAAFATRAQDWLADFAKRNETISDEDLRKSASKRVTEFRERIADIDKQVNGLLSDSHALEARLNDLRTFLGNDLTPGAISSVSGRISDATKDGRQIASNLGKLSKASEEMASKLRAAKVPEQV